MALLGPAPILDFDGTIAHLDIDWAELRRLLGVTRIADLWNGDTGEAWATVTAAETAAAVMAPAAEPVVAALEESVEFAVLTNNSEAAVFAFLERFPRVAARAVVVVGRETLGGPKTDYDVFSRGFWACVAATGAARGSMPVCYVGDQDYELDYARRLGAHVLAAARVVAH